MLLITLATLLTVTPGAGKKVSLDFKQAPAREVVALLADVSNRTMVVVDGGDTKLDLKLVDTPWDTALDQVVTMLGATKLSQGSVELIGKPESLARYPKKTFTGKKVMLTAVEADPRAVAEALARVADGSFALSEGTSRLTLRAHNVPVDQLLAITMLVTGAKETTRAAPAPAAPGCVASHLPMRALWVTTLVTGTANPLAVLEDDTGVSTFLGRKDCVSNAGWTVKRITRDEVALASGDVLTPGRLYEPELVRVSIADAMKQSENVSAEIKPWTQLLLGLARDVLKLKHIIWKKRDGAQYPFELAERVEAGLLLTTSTPAVVKGFVPQVKKKTSLMPVVSAWVLSTSGDHAAALAVLEEWVKLLGPNLGEEVPGGVAARKMLAWEREHGGDAAELDRLTTQLETSMKKK